MKPKLLDPRRDNEDAPPPEVGQAVPVRIYQTQDLLLIAVPMPGLEPDDITVAVEDDCLSIAGEERGPRQHERDLLLSEWSVGPYLRELRLPMRVRGKLTNASYGNGVLIVSIPKAAVDEPGSSAHFRLTTVAPGRGEHVGHQGRERKPVSTAEHAAGKHGNWPRSARSRDFTNREEQP
jgi:HSP20 family protein